MKTSKEKMMQALSGLISEDASDEVTSAVEVFTEDVRNSLHKEYETKLQKALDEHKQEKSKVEKEMNEGFAEAYQIISELQNRLEVQKEELQLALDEGFEEAYQMLMEERKKNETLEVDLYEQYDGKIQQIREFMIDKLDEFLSAKGDEFYEQARRDVSNDPVMAEHKVALDKILEVTANFISEDHCNDATIAKVDAMKKQMDELRSQSRILEAKAMRLSTENSKLNESIKHQAELLTESIKIDEKERVKKARTVEGRGEKVVQVKAKDVIISETINESVADAEDEDSLEVRHVEPINGSITEQWRALAGVVSAPKKDKKG